MFSEPTFVLPAIGRSTCLVASGGKETEKEMWDREDLLDLRLSRIVSKTRICPAAAPASRSYLSFHLHQVKAVFIKPLNPHCLFEAAVPGTHGACFTGSVSPAPSILWAGTCSSQVHVALLFSHSHSPLWLSPASLGISWPAAQLCESCVLGHFPSPYSLSQLQELQESKWLLMVLEKITSLCCRLLSKTSLTSHLPTFLSITSFPVAVGSLWHSVSLCHSLTPFRLSFTMYTSCLFRSLLFFLSACRVCIVCWIPVLSFIFLYLCILPLFLTSSLRREGPPGYIFPIVIHPANIYQGPAMQ